MNYIFQKPEQPTGWYVLVLAPTGLAAYNVNGQTIHRFLKMPVHNMLTLIITQLILKLNKIFVSSHLTLMRFYYENKIEHNSNLHFNTY